MSQIDDELIRAAQMAAIRCLGKVATDKHIKNTSDSEKLIESYINDIKATEQDILKEIEQVFKGKGSKKASVSITKEITKVNSLK